MIVCAESGRSTLGRSDCADLRRPRRRFCSLPNEAATARLVGAILMEQHDQWAVQRARYKLINPAYADKHGDQCRQLRHVKGHDQNGYKQIC